MKIFAVMVIVITVFGGIASAVIYISSNAVANHELPRVIEALNEKDRSTNSVLSESEEQRLNHEAVSAEKDRENARLRAESKALRETIALQDANPYCRPGCLIND